LPTLVDALRACDYGLGQMSDERPNDRAPEGGDDEAPDRRSLLERAIPEVVKRVVEKAVDAGVNRLTEGPENLRSFVGEVLSDRLGDRLGDRLPKEAISYLYQQVDDTKNGLYRVVAKEIRDVLEQTQFADEIAKILTKLSFEIRTEIRFVPNDRSQSEGGSPVRAEVKTQVARTSPKPRKEDE
jgi:hypothetical protein